MQTIKELLIHTINVCFVRSNEAYLLFFSFDMGTPFSIIFITETVFVFNRLRWQRNVSQNKDTATKDRKEKGSEAYLLKIKKKFWT